MLTAPLNLLLAGLLGLLIGSFLNVLIHRLPIMIEQAWSANETRHETLNLAWPRSHCPACKHPIAWHDNLPVLSFLRLHGRCRHCQTPIAWQYPLVETTSAVLFVWCAVWQAHPLAALAWAGFSVTLLALAVIDARTGWLPDALTQPLTWGGLIAASLDLSGVGLPQALAGAVGGYLSLWSVYWVFRLITGREGMGHGDFKLLAALGAWFGWQALLPLILIASLSGLAVGLWQRWHGELQTQQAMPFGPYLALAGAWLMFFGAPPLLAP
jgi:leader peptidase (prepilin peptidase)/N-methyltransferase